jgi:hypothetical protein
VVEFVDPETQEAVVLAYRVRGQRRTRMVVPRGLDAGRLYQIRDPFSSRKTRLVTGEALMKRGMRVSLEAESGSGFHLIPKHG